MKRWFVLILLFFAPLCHAAVRTMQVTVGSTTTQILSPGAHLQCRWIAIQNNAAHTIRIGDASTSSTRGILLASGSPGGSFYVGPDSSGTARDLGGWYINGTSGDVIDVVYDDGQ